MSLFHRSREPYEYSDLALYNSEKARGIVHTTEWDARMAERQERFNEEAINEAKAAPLPPLDSDRVVKG